MAKFWPEISPFLGLGKAMLTQSWASGCWRRLCSSLSARSYIALTYSHGTLLMSHNKYLLTLRGSGSEYDSLAKHRMRTAMIGYISIADQIYKTGNRGIYCVEWEPYFKSAICERHSRKKEEQLQAEARRSLSSLDWNCTGRPEVESK